MGSYYSLEFTNPASRGLCPLKEEGFHKVFTCEQSCSCLISSFIYDDTQLQSGYWTNLFSINTSHSPHSSQSSDAASVLPNFLSLLIDTFSVSSNLLLLLVPFGPWSPPHSRQSHLCGCCQELRCSEWITVNLCESKKAYSTFSHSWVLIAG